MTLDELESAGVAELSEKLNAELFPGPPDEERDAYDAIRAMNWSTLKHMWTSPKECQFRMTTATDSEAFTFGRAGHMCVLEPERFERSFGVYDGTFDKRHKAFQAWFAEHPGLTPLKPAHMDSVRRIRDAVYAHSDAAELLRGGRREEAIQWQDEATGIACKARLDYARPDMVVELKSTKDTERRWFTNDAAKFLYHGQLAWYFDGARASRATSADSALPPIIAVEKDPPHDVAVVTPGAETIAVGRDLYRHLLTKFVECTAADWWPGKAPTPWQLDLPPWAPGMDL